MTGQGNSGDAATGLTSNDLAFERTVLSHERTLMAWVRTATAMFSFGFAIYKIFEARTNGEKLLSPRAVAMIMVAFGLVSLLFAQVQHHVSMARLRKNYPAAQRSLASVLSVLVLCFGLAMFLAAVFRK
jgi:putative membrane protein